MSIEAEQSVIGALLMNNDAIDRIGDLLPEHFYRFEHQQIFSEIRAQISAGKQADVITVGIALGEKVPDAIAYLNAMSNSTPSSAGITRYAAIVINESVMRSLAALSNEIGEIIEANKESAVCVDLVAAKLEKLAQKRTQSEPRRLSDMLSNYVETIEKRMNGGIKPIATGYSDLDRKLGGGLERGTLCVIAGRPAMGKTALGLGIARNVSTWGSSLFLSMEMSETQVNDRNVGALGKIPMSFLRDPDCKTDGIDYWPNLTAAFKKAQEMNLFIDDQTGLNMIQIRAKARKVKRTHGLDLIVVDQLSFITGALSDKSWESTGEYTRALIQIAKELDVAVILLCQLNRECEKRADKRPLMADLAQSGSIEQDASNVILLYRDEVYNPETREKGIAEINIVKQRQGSPGVIGLVYIGDQTRFEDLSRPWERSEPVQQRSKKGLAELL
jgi:replicative DNA helicase